MKKIVVLSLCSFATLLAFQTVNAQTIAQWTFENTANTNSLLKKSHRILNVMG
jgi:hypothetical protein